MESDSDSHPDFRVQEWDWNWDRNGNLHCEQESIPVGNVLPADHCTGGPCLGGLPDKDPPGQRPSRQRPPDRDPLEGTWDQTGSDIISPPHVEGFVPPVKTLPCSKLAGVNESKP